MREIVHHIDGQSHRLCARRHGNADVTGAGAEDRDHIRQIGGERIARGRLDPCDVCWLEAGQIMIAVGRKPADPRAGRNQQAQFCAHELARSNEQHLAALQIQEHWQVAHQTLAFPNLGVD